MGGYPQGRDDAIERMILALGDTQPELSEILQKMIDDAKRGPSGGV